MRKIRKKILLPVCAAVFAAGYLALCQPLTVRQYTIWSEKVTSPVRLAVIADLHSTYYGDDQQQLLSVLRQEQPDAVLLVGDTADDEVPHDGAACLLSVIGTEFPCYLVFGNHEFWAEDFPDIQKMVQDSGVHLLRGESCLLQVGDTTIQLAGVDDPDGFADPAAWQAHLRETASGLQEGVATILLSHRPEQTIRENLTWWWRGTPMGDRCVYRICSMDCMHPIKDGFRRMREVCTHWSRQRWSSVEGCAGMDCRAFVIRRSF